MKYNMEDVYKRLILVAMQSSLRRWFETPVTSKTFVIYNVIAVFPDINRVALKKMIFSFNILMGMIYMYILLTKSWSQTRPIITRVHTNN